LWERANNAFPSFAAMHADPTPSNHPNAPSEGTPQDEFDSALDKKFRFLVSFVSHKKAQNAQKINGCIGTFYVLHVPFLLRQAALIARIARMRSRKALDQLTPMVRPRRRPKR
jgi:hypothetical protein